MRPRTLFFVFFLAAAAAADPLAAQCGDCDRDGDSPPIAVDDAAATREDAAVTVSAAANDVDADGDLDPATAEIVDPPAHGAATGQGGVFTYAPATDFFGDDAFSYRICDTQELCDDAVVTLTVEPVADPPDAVDDGAFAPRDRKVLIDVAANDVDADGDLDPETVAVVGEPMFGTVVQVDANGVVYAPADGFTGVDVFTYEICDGEKLCDAAEVTVTVGGVSWALYRGACEAAAGAADAVVPAGEYGVFYFSRRRLPACADTLAAGRDREPLRYYPFPGPAPLESSALRTPPAPVAPTKSLTVPTGPWVAVIDWDNWHGRSIDSLLRSATDLSIETLLLPLVSLLADFGGITDVDVLARFAELAEAVDGGAPPPLLINMSFGRLREPDDATGTACDPNRLSCQIALLAAHLAAPDPHQPPRTVLAAAAGNHGRLLFPAAIDHVVAVGALDLTAFAANGEARASWETPEDAQALMPGTAMCLQLFSGEMPIESPIPAGSSFAAVLFSGWLADVLLRDPEALPGGLPQGGRWEPRQVCEPSGCFFVLAHDETLFHQASGRASDRMIEVVDDSPGACGAGLGRRIGARLIAPPPEEADPLSYPSVVERVAAEHRPAPEPDPCVPCSLCCQAQQPGAMRTAPTKSLKPESREFFSVGIDMHSGWALPGGTELEAVYVRVDSELRKVDLCAEDLIALAGGHVNVLYLVDPIASPAVSRQPSLVFLLREERARSEPEYFWDATPLILRPGAGEPPQE